MKIYITGFSGFVGQNLIPYLGKFGRQIENIGRKELQQLDDFALAQSSTIIHLAGKAHDLRRVSNPDEYYQTNFDLTKMLYDTFLRSDAKVFIFISSVKAAADSVKDILLESYIPDPKTDYGKSKLMAEKYIQAQSLPEGKSYYILRPCMIHGLGNKGNLNLLYKFVQKGIPYPLAAFKNKRSFLSVNNLCFVIKELLDGNVPSGIYNVADDDALSTNEVVCLLASSLKKKPKLWATPTGLIKFLAKIGDKTNLPLNTETLIKLTENYIVSNSKIVHAMKKELPLSAKEGLSLTAMSFNR